MHSSLRLIVALFITVFLPLTAVAQQPVVSSRMQYILEHAKENPTDLRAFLKAFPKGGDIHNHLVGAVYAESYLEWAAEDGLCIDGLAHALRPPEDGASCDIPAKSALLAGPLRENVISALSMQGFVPTSARSGHDHFFATFNKIYYANFYQFGKGPLRSGDMLAEVTSRAEEHNLAYLELMHTMELGTILSLVPAGFGGQDQSIEALYKALMQGAFGKALPQMVSSAREHLDLAIGRKNMLLACEAGGAGCDVTIRFLHQVIREFSPPQVFAQLILGAELVRSDPRMVGLNMVAPEDGAFAMADYDTHMRMIDFLWQKEKGAGGELNISLHAGELTPTLVAPDGLRSHIHSAVHVAHARRIGHGVSITYEDNASQLLQDMADDKIMVEINLSSNETVLNVEGRDHPYALYKKSGVPMALSTDDEGISRINITHEYMRAVMEQGASYLDLITLSRNSLTYSFVAGESLWRNGAVANKSCALDLKADIPVPSDDCAAFLKASTKAMLQWQLEKNFDDFEEVLRANSQ